MNIPHEIEERCKNLKIGYAPLTYSMKTMGDLGRFCHYAHERNIKLNKNFPASNSVIDFKGDE